MDFSANLDGQINTPMCLYVREMGSIYCAIISQVYETDCICDKNIYINILCWFANIFFHAMIFLSLITYDDSSDRETGTLLDMPVFI